MCVCDVINNDRSRCKLHGFYDIPQPEKRLTITVEVHSKRERLFTYSECLHFNLLGKCLLFEGALAESVQ